MMFLRSLFLALVVVGVSVVAEQQVYDDAAVQGDDAAQAANDDGAAEEYEYYYDTTDYGGDFSAGDDTIQYWTDYAILPKRCIV